MRLAIAVLVVLSPLGAGCEECGKPVRSEATHVTADELRYVLVDRRAPSADVVSVIRGANAYTKVKPFRSLQPHDQRTETSTLPGEVVACVAGLLEAEGLEPPFVPGGPAFAVGAARPSSSELKWRYFGAENAAVAKCCSDLQSAIDASGRRVESTPEWLTNGAVRAVLGE